MSSTQQLDLMDVERRPTRSKLERILDIAEKQGFDVELIEGCVEPGYDDKPVALADWNDVTRHDPFSHENFPYRTVDNTPPRLAKLFEKLGYAVEWSDEWYTCEGCYKAVRCSPDSYSWKPYFWGDSGILCGDCVKDDPADYLESLSGNPQQCMQLDIDLAEHGYKLHSGDYEVGWHPGQNADPTTIAERLHAEGVEDFIFVLDSKGQFDIGFSVWAKLPSGCYGIGDPVTLCKSGIR